jgi:chemotaxis protein MotB
MTLQRSIVAGSFLLLLSTCGIDEQVHKKALDDLANTQGELDGCKAARQAAEETAAAQKERIGELEGSLRSTGMQAEQTQTELASVKTNLMATESELQELRKQREAAEKRLAAFRKLQEKLRKLIDTGKLKVNFRHGQMVLELPSDVLFKSGHSKLGNRAQAALSEVTDILLEFKDRRLMIAGHTDNRPISTKRFPNNWHLSTARAVSVLDFFVSQGFDPTKLAATGYGEFDPVGDNETEAGREQNRRIEIILVPDLSELPTMTKG